MKNIIIGGTTRAGKTTLANLIVKKLKYSKCENDTIVNAFDKVFPELGITHKGGQKAEEIFKPFLFEVLNGFCRDLKYGNIVTVFPGSQFSPEAINEYEKKDKYIVIFLGVEADNPQLIVDKIRECDTEADWTHKKDDEWMLGHCKNVINKSKILKEECEKYGFYYFNTFENREKTLNAICDMVKELEEV